MKSYYVLQRGSLYVYERDNYDKPLETVQLESYRMLPGTSPVHNGRQWVLQVQRGEEQPVCLACEDGETYVRWKESIGEAIRLGTRQA